MAGLLLAQGDGAAKGKKYALLVGVSYYKNFAYSPLRGTKNDVVELAKVLREPECGFEVTLLTSEPGHKDPKVAPTAANIRKELKNLLAGKGREDTVLIALAGHGADIEVPDPEGKKPANTYTYFFPTDADELGHISHSTGHSEHLIELGDLFRRLEAPKCGAGVKLVLVDACRDSLKATSSLRSLTPTRVTVPAGVNALFSCGPGQSALETGFDVGGEERRVHGVFFWHVIQGLKGEARNKRDVVNWAGLAGYLQSEVPAFVRDVAKRKAPQRPHVLGDMEDEVVLVRPKVMEKEFTNVLGMKLVGIPGGKFTMGSSKEEAERDEEEGPQHEVEVSEFYLGAHEVTVGQFRAFANAAGYRTEAEKGDGAFRWSGSKWEKDAGTSWKNPRFLDFSQGEDHPVTCVSWNDAKAFCDWLSKQPDRKRPAGWAYRLPREAEWEYACRGGPPSYSCFHFGNTLSSAQANFDARRPYGGAGKGDYLGRTTKVGTYGKNAFGLYDMHGNAAEWCADWFDKDYYYASPSRDPAGPPRGSERVIRGGSWRRPGGHCRSAYRIWSRPDRRDNALGFRVALVPSGRAKVPE
jgi:formylglycine-generating enzyme required for sulfatase activity